MLHPGEDLKDRFGHDYYLGGMNAAGAPVAPPIESRPLRYFVAVAEELNFARAAERLGIASPALSRAIAQLETQLGVRLFERSTRHVALTDAGAVLLDQARPALDSLDAAARRAQRAAGPRHRLVLALKADLEGGLLEAILAAYREQPEEVPVEVSFADWDHLAERLRDGRADVALIYTDFDDDGLDQEVLLEEPRVAALAATHPLAAREAAPRPRGSSGGRTARRPRRASTASARCCS